MFEAKVLKENVDAATKLLGEMVTGKADVEGAKANMLAELDATRLHPELVTTCLSISTVSRKNTNACVYCLIDSLYFPLLNLF